MSREPSNALHGVDLKPLTDAVVLAVSSPSFKDGESIPVQFTADGENINPGITIETFPAGTKSLSLVVLDKISPNQVVDHWILWNIPPTTVIYEHSAPGQQGRNSFGSQKYVGPRRASVDHTYIFRIYALNTIIDVKPGADRIAVEKAMTNHMLAAGELSGKYGS